MTGPMDREGWRLERHVTLGVVIAMTVQAAAALTWFGATGERLEQLERRADLQGPVVERLARLEVAAARNQASLSRIEDRLDGLDRDGGRAANGRQGQ